MAVKDGEGHVISEIIKNKRGRYRNKKGTRGVAKYMKY
jgi:hypothetical protein